MGKNRSVPPHGGEPTPRPRRAKALLGAMPLLLFAGLPTGVTAQNPPPSPPIDSDLAPQPGQPPRYPSSPAPPSPTPPPYPSNTAQTPAYGGQAPPPPPPSGSATPCGGAHGNDGTYRQDDLIGAAEGVFGEGAHGLADVIQDILKKQGRPNGYIIGREAGGAIAVGLRYGSGVLCSQVVGSMPVYWTGPSIGFDAGASAAKTFVLVYNLYRADDIFHRYGAGEGQAYLVGGFHVSYLRDKDVVLIPVRFGVGLRLGINGGYMKFTHHQTWFPF